MPRAHRGGYRCRGENGIAGWRYDTLDDATGRRRFQVRCFEPWSRAVERHLTFRDFLRKYSETAPAYEPEKRRGRELHTHDSAAYCDAKSGWIAGVFPVALTHFAGCSIVGDGGWRRYQLGQ